MKTLHFGFVLLLLLPLFSFGQDTIIVANIERYQELNATHSFNDIVVDAANNKWIITDKGGFKIPNFYKPADTVSNVGGKALAIDRNNQVWMDQFGQPIYNPKTGQALSYRATDGKIKVNSMSSQDSLLWVGTDNGLYVFLLDDFSFVKKMNSSNSKIPDNIINDVFADDRGVVWVGTNKGICRIANKGGKAYEKNNRFTAISSSKEGIWINGSKEMWLVDHYNRWYPAAIDKKLSRGAVRGICSDKNGIIYIASEILVQYNPYKNEINIFDEKDGLVNTEFLCIVADDYNHIWAGTANQGLYRITFTEEYGDRLTALAIVQEEIKCYGQGMGSILINAKGGKGPYRYLWDNLNLDGPNPKNLAAGDYAVTVMDSEGKSIEIMTTLTQPSQVIVKPDYVRRISAKGMKDGRAKVNVQGGKAPYAYLWSNGQTTDIAKRLPMGFHNVTVTDGNGCENVMQLEIQKESAMPDLVIKDIEEGQTLTVNELSFKADSTEITSASYPVLEEIENFLNENPKVKIEVGGHTNNIPSDEFCFRLSTARAKNIAEYLYKKGIRPERVTYKGYGKTTPIASNMTEAGRKRNQRVEIKIISLKD